MTIAWKRHVQLPCRDLPSASKAERNSCCMKDRGICRGAGMLSCQMAVRRLHTRHQDGAQARKRGNPKR